MNQCDSCRFWYADSPREKEGAKPCLAPLGGERMAKLQPMFMVDDSHVATLFTRPAFHCAMHEVKR